jgi:hypothetical protein
LIHGKKVAPPAARGTRAVRGRPARVPLVRRNSDLSASDSSDDDSTNCR